MNIFGLGTPEIILILVIFLLFFGKDKFPALAKSVAKSFNDLKAGFIEAKDELEIVKDSLEKNDLVKK